MTANDHNAIRKRKCKKFVGKVLSTYSGEPFRCLYASNFSITAITFKNLI